MAKRRDFSKRQCPRCGGNVGVIKRDTALPKRFRLDLLGCVSGIHVNSDSTTGYDLTDFPLRKRKA